MSQKKQGKQIFRGSGVKHPAQNPDIYNKIKKTNLERYGSTTPSKNKQVIEKINSSFRAHVQLDPNKNFRLINILRGEEFWNFLTDSKVRLIDAADRFELQYPSLRNALVSEEFVEKYREYYEIEKRKTQKIISEYVKDIIDDDSIKISINNRKEISPLELDIYVPDKKFAIEYNGNFWHSEFWLTDKKKSKWNHLNKTKLCQEKGIRLLHIFEHQWANRETQLLNFIRTILGENEINIPARKCVVTNNDSSSFIDDNHIQGKTHAVLQYFNLEYNGEIVASMTASRHHRQNSDAKDLVLSRLCFKGGVNVQGGASKLFKYFVDWARQEGFNRIVSWSDSCWTEGKIYPVLGFTMEKESAPDYFYYDVNKHTVHSKQSQKKSATGCPKDVTERIWCQSQGLYRVYDCGKKKWILDLNKKEE